MINPNDKNVRRLVMKLDKALCEEHKTVTLYNHRLKSIQIDEELAPLISYFWVLGGESYCSCQGVNIKDFKPLFINSKGAFHYCDKMINAINFMFLTSVGILGAIEKVEKPFVIIRKIDYPLFKKACKDTGWKPVYRTTGSNGYMCEWIKGYKTMDYSKMLYVSIERI